MYFCECLEMNENIQFFYVWIIAWRSRRFTLLFGNTRCIWLTLLETQNQMCFRCCSTVVGTKNRNTNTFRIWELSQIGRWRMFPKTFHQIKFNGGELQMAAPLSFTIFAEGYDLRFENMFHANVCECGTLGSSTYIFDNSHEKGGRRYSVVPKTRANIIDFFYRCCFVLYGKKV